MALSAESFLNARIGLPYLRGAQGPKAYDCWGLFRETQNTLFDRDLPAIPVNTDMPWRAVLETFAKRDVRSRLSLSARPQAGGMVLMEQASDDHHIGTWFDFDGGGVFHALEPFGVSYDDPAHLRLQGWQRIRFYGWTA